MENKYISDWIKMNRGAHSTCVWVLRTAYSTADHVRGSLLITDSDYIPFHLARRQKFIIELFIKCIRIKISFERC